MDPAMMARERAWPLLLLSLTLLGTTVKAQSSTDFAPLELIQGGGTPASIGPNALRILEAKL